MAKNPLTLLHQPLSEGLHDLTDEECLQQAADIRIVLTALLENIADVLKGEEELKAGAARLRRDVAKLDGRSFTITVDAGRDKAR